MNNEPIYGLTPSMGEQLALAKLPANWSAVMGGPLVKDEPQEGRDRLF